MLNEMATHLPSLGIAGLLFVMWWYERQERSRAASSLQEARQATRETTEINDHLLSVIRGNTEAITALREELRSHRTAEVEWWNRLSRQLEKLAENRNE